MTPEFDSSQVEVRLRGLVAEINRCYERELSLNPEASGRVGLRFTIVESGHVENVQIDSVNAVLGQCVSSVIERLHFDPGPIGGAVTYSTTFVFSSE